MSECSKKTNIRNDGIDCLKCLCAFFVICIHKPFPSQFNQYIFPFIRVAVPIFFMITGFFYCRTEDKKKEIRQIKKICIILFYANLLYLVWEVVKILILKKSLIIYFNEILKLKSIMKMLIFNESPFSGHLWYLFAILYVLLIVLFLEKNINKNKLYVLIPCLLIGDLLFGKYSNLIWGVEFPLFLVRNFLFVGIPYFYLGDYISEKIKNINLKKLRWPCSLLIIIFYITTLLEKNILIMYNMNTSREHYASTTFLAITIFLFFISFENEFKKYKFMYVFSKIGLEYSMLIYVIHVIIIQCYNKFIPLLNKRVKGINNIYEIFAPFLIFITTLILANIFINLKKNKLYKFGFRL